MKAVFVSCTVRAYDLASELDRKWKMKYPDAEVAHIVKCAALKELSVRESISEAVGEFFGCADLIVFFTAMGIAVRSVAPFIEHKSVDPAVVVVDECGRYSVSMLSGHHGGANQYAREIAELIGAEPVITTATDSEGKFAVDEFARVNNLEVTDWEMAKRISAEILSGGEIALFDEAQNLLAVSEDGRMYAIGNNELSGIGTGHTEEKYTREKPESLRYGIIISNKISNKKSNKKSSDNEYCACENLLQLIPKNIYLGIGCKKGTDSIKIQTAVEKALERANISRKAVAKAASINLKADEPGILEFCERNEIEFVTFSADELLKVEGSVSGSSFVQQVTGVDNVCERSALAAGGGRLILPKQVFEGVTVAVAEGKDLLKEVLHRFRTETLE